MRKRVTLRAVGEFWRENVSSSVGWVTMDMSGIRVFDKRGEPPKYDLGRHIWRSEENSLISAISIPESRVVLRDYTTGKNMDYSKCIECVDPALMPERTEESQKQSTKHRSGVLAYFADGTTLRFDSKCEARNFFGFRRVEQVTKYIETGHPLPDGTTTLDEAIDDKPVDFQSKRKARQ